MSASPPALQFEAQASALPGAREVMASRRTALARYETLGMPHRGIETWRYTDLSSLESMALDYIATAPSASVLSRAAEALAGLALDPDEPRLVFVDGCWAESLSLRPATPGIAIDILSEQPAALLAGDSSQDSALAALNRALASGGARIHASAPAGGSASQPTPAAVHIVSIGSGRGQAVQLRFRIALDRDARLIVQDYRLDLDASAAAWLNTTIEIEQAEDSQLELLRLQRHGENQYATELTQARLAARARLSSGSVEIGGRLVRNEIEIRLEGAEAAAEIAGLALTRDRQHCDTRIAVDHRAPRTTSRQDYRAIADGESQSIFNGKVTVREGAQNIDARQRNDNLLLSRRAEIDTKPELEIYADQVACSHGATVGEISEDELFYLRARGIEEDAARAILTSAFAARILERFAFAGFRQRAQAAVLAWLPAGPAGGE